jgi:hypothetical protein
MSPTEVDKQSMWQFAAAWNGYVAANSPDKGRLSEREVEELFDWIDVAGTTDAVTDIPTVSWDGARLLGSRPVPNVRSDPLDRAVC